MSNVVVEIGIKLKENLVYYQDILAKAGAVNRFNCETHDIYYTSSDLNGLSENQMKKSCVRYRMVRGIGGIDFKGNSIWRGSIENYQIFDSSHEDRFPCDFSQFKIYEQKLKNSNYIQVFDTYKKDYQYTIGHMKSRIQLQEIKDIGLLLYYDNPDYYELPQEEQRKKLIDELNSYGLTEFNYETPGLDKLRTLYYKKEYYSNNQNG